MSMKATKSSRSNRAAEKNELRRTDEGTGVLSKVAQINVDSFENACVEIALPIHTRLGRALCGCLTKLRGL